MAGRGRRILRWLGLAVAVVVAVTIVAGVGGYLYLKRSTLPQGSGTLRVAGLHHPVEVIRDSHGIPTIEARDAHDLFFALGVVHAQDRLWQMDFQRRIGRGTLSGVLGRATVEQDEFVRTWGFYRAAREAYRNLDPASKRMVDDYVAGINAYLKTDPPLPVEFRLLGYRPAPWRPADVLVWAKLQSFELSANWDSELERYRLLARGLSKRRIAQLLPPYPKDAPTVLSGADVSQGNVSRADAEQAEAVLRAGRSLPEALAASNDWVVSGRYTTTGKPFLANDPHLGLQAPSIWYLVHLKSPGIDATGASFPGLPAVVIGHNRHIAWGVTNVGADVEDLYVMHDVDGGRAYIYRGKVRPYRVRHETIEVKGAKPVHLSVRESVYGPVISDVEKVPGGRSLSLHWTSLAPKDGTIGAFLGVEKAENWRQFNAALRSYVAPSQNFVYADKEGNIGYVAPGKFPIRKKGDTGLYPMPGNGSWDWRGWVPYRDWPRTFNPREGFVVTANNKVTPKDYPYTLSLEWADPYRAERIRQMIEEVTNSGRKLSRKDMERIQLDQKSLLFESFRPVIEDMHPRTGDGETWRKRLLRWDGKVSPSSREAALFEGWYARLTRLPAKEVGEEHWDHPRYILNALEHGDRACGTRKECLAYAARAFDRTLEGFGGNVPRWGDIHKTVIDHPVLSKSPLARFADRTLPHGGDESTVNVGSYDPSSFEMTAGPSYRQVVSLADPGDSRFVMPMGESGNLLSSHYDDLLPLWQDGRYLPMRGGRKGLGERLLLEP